MAGGDVSAGHFERNVEDRAHFFEGRCYVHQSRLEGRLAEANLATKKDTFQANVKQSIFAVHAAVSALV